MEKKPGAFWTISEVAVDLELPQHVLRFWETRFPQIKPLKSGGGRRYYRPQDVDLIRGIRSLLYDEGYTIKGVQRILKEKGILAVQEFSSEQNYEDDNEDYEFTSKIATSSSSDESDDERNFFSYTHENDVSLLENEIELFVADPTPSKPVKSSNLNSDNISNETDDVSHSFTLSNNTDHSEPTETYKKPLREGKSETYEASLLSSSNISKLMSALEQLQECQRLLKTVHNSGNSVVLEEDS